MAAWDRVLRDEFEKSLATHQDHVAITCGGRELTYEDLDVRSRQTMAGFAAQGLSVGDRVAVCLHNSVESVIAELAILRYGACKVPINVNFKAAQVAGLLEHSGGRLLIAAGDQATAILQADPPDDLETVVRVGDGHPEATPFHEFGAGSPPGPRQEIRPDSPAAIFYTGGTTGAPKGVCHLQEGMVACLYSHIIEAEISADERLLLTTPLNHAAGMFLLTGLLRGAHVTIHEGFDIEDVQDALASGITWSFMVPTMIYRLLEANADQGTPAPSLRTVVYGAAPIMADRLRDAIDVFGPVFVQLYAQTECPDFATTLKKRDHVKALSPEDAHLLGSCGQAVLMTDVQVVDDQGTKLGPDEIGEVCLRSPYTMSSYYRDPEATAKVLGDDGWLRTGDIGQFDEQGYLYLKDRRNDVVVSGGLNVYSGDVETIVGRAPGVADVAIIGIPHDDWGEAVHAVILLQPDGDRSSVEEHCRASLAAYQRPKTYEYVDRFPLTPYGKIDKKRLREPHWRGRDRSIH
jgi:fatty-acyl-CoA synthase/long-chain acyl-CoA synthetase